MTTNQIRKAVKDVMNLKPQDPETLTFFNETIALLNTHHERKRIRRQKELMLKFNVNNGIKQQQMKYKGKRF